MEPISLYIHIPFCKSKCNYCDFLSFSKEEILIDPYIKALLEEIKNYGVLFANRKVVSIFLGGGTPSILPTIYIDMIMQIIKESFHLTSDLEVTIECNPESLSDDKIRSYKSFGINRISIGLQSADNESLKKLGRIHTFETFVEKYNNLRFFGYDNINVDLMFGLPNQTLKDWHMTLNKIIELDPEHISIYGLNIEENTPFYTAEKLKQIIMPDEEVERIMYWDANELLVDNGYKHYEISNYSKEGYECKHNKVYWTLGEYIGIGLGAASYYLDSRNENLKDINKYIKANGNLEKTVESKKESSIVNKMEEWVFLGLRLIEGIDKKQFNQIFDKSFKNTYGDIVKKLINEGLIDEHNDVLSLTNRGIDVSNYVLSHFIL